MEARDRKVIESSP